MEKEKMIEIHLGACRVCGALVRKRISEEDFIDSRTGQRFWVAPLRENCPADASHPAVVRYVAWAAVAGEERKIPFFEGVGGEKGKGESGKWKV